MDQFRPQRFEILPFAVKNLLIINGLMFAATFVFKNTMNVNLIRVLGLHYFTSDQFQPYQLISHMFMHGSVIHIFSNMFALWMFGSALENIWGTKKFLTFYFSCGLGGALMHLGITWWNYQGIEQDVISYQLHPGLTEFVSLIQRHSDVLSGGYAKSINDFYNNWRSNPADPTFLEASRQMSTVVLKAFADVPIVGASGAVFGVLVAFGLLFPNVYLYLYFFFPLKAKYFVIFYAAFELYAGISGSQDGVAHFAHIGGALVGFIIVKYWGRNLRKKFF
ncbi:MAG: rhomboid family intramembrane serine protease [Chitinophagales bacterium]